LLRPMWRHKQLDEADQGDQAEHEAGSLEQVQPQRRTVPGPDRAGARRSRPRAGSRVIARPMRPRRGTAERLPGRLGLRAGSPRGGGRAQRVADAETEDQDRERERTETPGTGARARQPPRMRWAAERRAGHSGRPYHGADPRSPAGPAAPRAARGRCPAPRPSTGLATHRRLARRRPCPTARSAGCASAAAPQVGL